MQKATFGFKRVLERPSRPWLETREGYTKRLKTCCDAINRDLNVEGLCRGFPKRIANLRRLKGGRLNE